MKSKKNIFTSNEISSIKRMLIIFTVVYVLFSVFLSKGYIASGSMKPTLMTGSKVLYMKSWCYPFAIKRGKIIEFRHGSEIFSKRVIGLPGESIRINNGKVYVNNIEVVEKYIMDGATTEPLTGSMGNGKSIFIVPDNSYFVLGDNREASSDSRAWDDPFVKKSDITGIFLSIFF